MEKKIGIYKITSPGGKIYIGQSIHIDSRKKNYELINCKGQKLLYYSLIKYGFENHIFETIEECSIELLHERETFWKKYYLEQNNNDWSKMLFCELYDKGSGGPMSEATKQKISKSNIGVKRHSDEWKLFKSINQTGRLLSQEAKDKIGDIHRGLKYSEESKQKIRDSKIGQKYSEESKKRLSEALKGGKRTEEQKQNMRKPRSEEARKNMSLTHKGKSNPKNKKPIQQFDLEGNFIRDWDGATDANKELGINLSDITSCCKGKLKTAGKFIWKYKEK